MDWFKFGKGARQGCILSPGLFNLDAKYAMRNARLDESQTGIKTVGRNTNNLRYADDATLMAERDDLKSLLMKLKEETEKAGLKLNIQKIKIMASSPDGEMWKQCQISFSWTPKSLWTVTAATKLKDSCSLEEKL